MFPLSETNESVAKWVYELERSTPKRSRNRRRAFAAELFVHNPRVSVGQKRDVPRGHVKTGPAPHSVLLRRRRGRKRFSKNRPTITRRFVSAEPGDEPVAGRDAPVVRRLAGAGRAERPGRGARVPDGGPVAREDRQRAARGALQPGHGPDGHGDRVRHSRPRVRTVALRGRAEDGVRGPPVQGRRGADQRPVRSHIQGTYRLLIVARCPFHRYPTPHLVFFFLFRSNDRETGPFVYV